MNLFLEPYAKGALTEGIARLFAKISISKKKAGSFLQGHPQRGSEATGWEVVERFVEKIVKIWKKMENYVYLCSYSVKVK